MNDMYERATDIVTDRQPVKIKLSSRHIVHDMERFAKYGNFMTMFDPPHQSRGEGINPEDYPEEMNDALYEIMERENSVIGYPTEEELDAYCSEEEVAEEADIAPEVDFSNRLETFLRLLEADMGEEDDAFVFETEGVIEKVVTDGGKRVVEVAYKEAESMDDTYTVIRFDPDKEGVVSIYHTGSVISALVCEEGVRHITVYQTPIAPFELALYTKKCRGGFTYSMGGILELDYIVELRGADLQRTILKIEVEPIR